MSPAEWEAFDEAIRASIDAIDWRASVVQPPNAARARNWSEGVRETLAIAQRAIARARRARAEEAARVARSLVIWFRDYPDNDLRAHEAIEAAERANTIAREALNLQIRGW